MDRPTNKLDVVVVEATDILEDGSIVLGASVGATPELIQLADKVSSYSTHRYAGLGSS